ncbi:MFS transporter [Marinicauda sp. Alg238-R41]|uniref:MFS transporter n=1 Tax=Marinicauda sp. Alg238-R41 TaxID=2993447 RepID=UPI0022DF1C5C|nr:MFS transporter [Marinicauda sp. Alg238-R41]
MIAPEILVHRRVLVFALLCAFLSSPGQTFFIAAFTSSMAQAAGITAGELGLVYMAATLGAAGLLPLAGSWIDHLELKRYTALSLSGLTVACIITALAQGPLMLLLGLLCLRLTGQGLMSHIAVTSTARFFTAWRGRALALVALGFPLAEALTPAAGVAMIAGFGWRQSYLLVALGVLLIATPALLVLLKDQQRFCAPPNVTATERTGRGGLASAAHILFSSAYFWLVLPVVLYLPFASTGLIFHVQTLATSKGWPIGLIGPGFLVFAGGHVLGLIVSGRIIDRFNAKVMLPAMNLPFFLGLAGLATASDPVMLAVFLGLLGASAGLSQTSVAAMWAEVYGVERMGTIRSLAVMLMVVGTASGPAVVGGAFDADLGVATIAAVMGLAGLAASALSLVALMFKTAPSPG